MSVEKYRHELGTIIVPDPFHRREYDKQVVVTPITDEWFVSPERTWNEVDAVLEGRLQGIQTLFSFDKTPTDLARKYGIERPVGGNMTRFLAYVELLDDYRLDHERHKEFAQFQSIAYEKEKESIKAEKKGFGKTQNKIQLTWERKYAQPINLHSQLAKQSEEVMDLIMKKGILDLLSLTDRKDGAQTPLIIEGFPKLLDDAKANFQNNQNTVPESFKLRDPINYFLDRLTGYISKTQDSELMRLYKYRKSPFLVQTKKDCQILDEVINYAQDTLPFGISPQTANQLEKIGKALLNFLVKRSQIISQQSFLEEYPILGLFYDVLTVAFYRGKPNILKKIGSLVDYFAKDIIHSAQLNREIERCIAVWWKSAKPVYTFIANNLLMPDNLRISFNSPDTSEKLPPELAVLFKIPEEMLLNGLSVFTRFTKEGEPEQIPSVEGSKVIQAVNKKINSSKDRIARKDMAAIAAQGSQRTQVSLFEQSKVISDKDIKKLNDFRLIKTYETGMVFAIHADLCGYYPKSGYDRGCEVDLLMIINSQSFLGKKSRFHENIDTLIESGESHFRMNQLPATSSKEKIGYLKGLRYITESETALINYYLGFFSKKENNVLIDLVERENDFLWDQVLNNQIWFVSPRGDRFSGIKDFELDEWQIDTMTFYMDKQFPREYRVAMQLVDFDQLIGLWLDTKQNVLGSQHQLLGVDAERKQRLTNVLLKRLYFITSGLSAKEQEATVGLSEGSRVIDYRRAHYRFLTSTPEHPITLESWSAHAHAREIRETYGIDIYEENKRRRGLGTLPPNQYLTFVSEVVPVVKTTLVLPNDLSYDPQLVKMPV